MQLAPETVALSEVDEIHGALQSWIEELEDGLGRDPPDAAFAPEPPAPVFGQPFSAPFAMLNSETIAAALLTRTGELVSATIAFSRGGGDRWLDKAVVATVAATGAVRFEHVTAEDAGAVLIAYAPASQIASWRLPQALHEAAADCPTGVVLLSTMIGDRFRPLSAACHAYGLTGLQTKVAIETVRVGGIHEASKQLGVSYQTAREAMSQTLKRVGVKRLPGLVAHLTKVAFGVFPGPEDDQAITDIWGLSSRQIAIAGLVAEGLSRDQVAKSLGLSEAVIRKELETVFALLQITSSAQLARKIVEARAFSWLTRSSEGVFGFLDDPTEPQRILLRPDGSRVGWSDYGPATGKPVFVIHSSMTTRIVSRKILRALHGAGYRPISIDRPGFGLTDPIAGLDPGGHEPFEAATSDVALVMEKLKLQRIDVVARGGAQFVAALSRAYPDLLGRVVLVNPGPPYRYSGRGIGPLSVIKAAFLKNPGTIALIAHFMAGHLTRRRLARMLDVWTRGSAPDQLAIADPEIVNDFYRSVRMFPTGRFQGFISEQLAITNGVKPSVLTGCGNWRVILGASDVLYDPKSVLAYWRSILPEAHFEVIAEGGRFLAMTHPELLVQALKSGWESDRAVR